jgi:hypothetical protein
MEYAVEVSSYGTIYVPSLMKICPGFEAILRFRLRNLSSCNVGNTKGKGFVMQVVEIPSCGLIFLPSFIKIGPGVHTVLRFGLSSVNGCNDSITDRKELLCAPLRWAQIA